jgi:hypothetical protein
VASRSAVSESALKRFLVERLYDLRRISAVAVPAIERQVFTLIESFYINTEFLQERGQAGSFWEFAMFACT